MTEAGLLSREWPPGLFDLRLACEECHKRKIRCEAPLDGSQSSCQACQANRRTCLFSLKNKTGRPRKSKPAQTHRASKQTFSPRALAGPRAGPGSPPATITTAPSYEFVPDARSEGLVLERRSSFVGGHYAERVVPCDAGREPSGETHHTSRRLAWLPGITAGGTGFDLPFNDPSGGGELPASPLLMDLGEDFGLDMLHSATTPPSFPSFSHTDQGCDQPGLYQRDRPNHVALWTRLPTGEPTDVGGPGDDLGQTDSAQEEAGTTSGGNTNTAAGNGDFVDLMRLCSEMTSSQHQSKVLDVMAGADKQELSAVIGNIEELGHQTAAAMRSAARAAAAPPRRSSSRQEQYKWMLTRVAVMGAVDIAADLVEHNLSIHKIESPPAAACEADVGGGPGLSKIDATAAAAALHGRRRLRDHCDDASSANTSAADTLGSVLALVRLDHSLLHFSLFLSADQRDMEGCLDPSSAGMSRSVLARIAQIRAQVWALAEGIRSLW